MKPLVAILALLITACTSTGVVAVGDDTYMIGKRSAQAGFGPPAVSVQVTAMSGRLDSKCGI